MYAEKLPPHDLEAEEAVIGSLLLDSEAIAKVAPFLRPSDFFREAYRWCYEACLALFQHSTAVNQVTVGHELQQRGRLDEVGGQASLSHLVAKVPTSLHVEHYARIVVKTATLRELIRAGSEIVSVAYEGSGDLDSVINRAEDLLYRVRSGRPMRGFASLRELLDRYLAEDAAASAGEPVKQGAIPLPSGFADLDQLLGGLQPSDLVILAARPSMGKSSLALNIARAAASRDVNATVAIFSLEMSAEQVALRLLASEAGVEGRRLRHHLVTEAEHRRIIQAIGDLSDLPIFIDDTPLASVVEVRSKAKRIALDQKLGLVIVDYLQLIQGGNGRSDNRVQEMSEISRSLKGLARDLIVPVIGVSQLSRAVEQRPTHRPMLSDLRESGSIEQDADVVLFIYREDAYTTEEEWLRHSPDKLYPKNIAEIMVAKHRHGPVGSINLRFNPVLARFEAMPALRAEA